MINDDIGNQQLNFNCTVDLIENEEATKWHCSPKVFKAILQMQKFTQSLADRYWDMYGYEQYKKDKANK
jgi:hypothetical protein